MKKLFAITIASALLLSAIPVVAQEAVINCQANLEAGISISLDDGNINFGTILLNTTYGTIEMPPPDVDITLSNEVQQLTNESQPHIPLAISITASKPTGWTWGTAFYDNGLDKAVLLVMLGDGAWYPINDLSATPVGVLTDIEVSGRVLVRFQTPDSTTSSGIKNFDITILATLRID